MLKIPDSWSDKYQYDLFKELGNKFYDKWESELEEQDKGAVVSQIKEFEKDARLILDKTIPTGILSGYYELDQKIEGFDPGELIVISGATGTGKTLFALNMIMNSFLDGMYPVLIFTLEMTKPQITSRIIQILESDNKLKLKDLPIFFYSSKNEPTIPRMSKAIIEMKEKYGIALVMIDHLHYFSRSIQNQIAELGILTREIKRIAVNEKLPILLLAQPKKKYTSSEPELDDIKGASDITQDADTVIQLQRDVMNAIKNNLLNVYITKNRNKGHIGMTEMVIEPKTWRLRSEEKKYFNND